MKKLMMIAAVASLSACMGGSTVATNKATTVGPTACGDNPYMQSVNNLPVRCGPQTELPYTYR